MGTENRLLRYFKTADIRLEKVESLLKREAKVHSFSYENDLSTALLYAARNPNVGYKVIELLLRKGANVNARNFNDGLCTPLIYAARNPKMSYKGIELLLRKGANVNARNFNDGLCTPLIYAARNPNMSYKGIEVLLKYGAVVDASNCIDGKCTALIYAARNPNPSYKVIEVLIRNGAYVHSRNYNDGQCVALLYALRNANVNYDAIKCLLENGANVHSANGKDGNYNALIYAVRKRDIDPALVELLLHHVEDTHTTFRPAFPCMPCLQMLKYIVLERVKKNPSCINGSCTCKSVLGDYYFDLLSRHFPRYGFTSYVEECVLEIRQMKVDGIYPLFSPSSIKESSFVESRAIVQRLMSIWSDNSSYPLYARVIQTDMKIKDLLNVLPRFQICTRCDREGTQRASFLDYDDTLLVLEYITLEDMLRLLEAFYCVAENALTTSERHLSPRKKRKLC